MATTEEVQGAVQAVREAAARPHGTAADIAHVKHILQGDSVDPEEALELSRRLAKHGRFSYARRVLAKVLDNPAAAEAPELRLRLAQQHAWCCCHDHGARAHKALARALEILGAADDLAQTRDVESLGKAGALHKRLWEVDGQRWHLERALAFYRRAYESGEGEAKINAGVNAAALLDLMADAENREAVRAGIRSEGASVRQEEAKRIREGLVALVPELPAVPDTDDAKRDWHFLANVAEIYYGLKRYDEASAWLKKATALPVNGRELEATARHLAMMARWQEGALSGKKLAESPAWICLEALLGPDVIALATTGPGKLGLALSGGGFRAAFFHIGVLARLAELDVLRSIEVISCVSGGSIIGGLYYLEVRKLLHDKADAEITRDDYIAIVQRLERNLMTGIQKNIRMLVAADGLAILRVIFDRDYSRTVRAGELYEQEIYDLVDDDKERRLRNLRIVPKGAPATFHPRHDNWRRRAKVPAIVINATTLNTGHNWQFTTSWMGEPPSGIPREVDSNERLRRLYYQEAPLAHRDIRLGKAVAASACVPGIFEPVTLSGLYPRRTIRLVDGGVHDNQGIGGILDEHCKVVLVSDASGQMESLLDPGTNVFTVLSRSDDIARVHVRAAQYDGLETRCRAALLNSLMFVHLKKDLDVQQVSWIGCDDPKESPDTTGRGARADYGIPKRLQERLAAVRTDLDTFCDQEAYALMLSGYRMTSHEFPRRVRGYVTEQPAQVNWRFFALIPAVIEEAEPDHEHLHRVLDVARYVTFKIWRLAPGILGVLLLLAGLVPAGAWLSAREAGAIEGYLPTLGVGAAFCIFYFMARLLIRRAQPLPSPLPGALGFLLWVSVLLLISEALWWARLLWLWGTGFSVGTGLSSWLLAGISSVAGLMTVMVCVFICVYALTRILRGGKSWSEVAIGLGFLFFLPWANLHLLTYDRWYLWFGRVRKAEKIVERPGQEAAPAKSA